MFDTRDGGLHVGFRVNGVINAAKNDSRGAAVIINIAPKDILTFLSSSIVYSVTVTTHIRGPSPI